MGKLVGRDLFNHLKAHPGKSAEEVADFFNTTVADVRYVFRNTQRPKCQTPLFKQDGEDGEPRYYASEPPPRAELPTTTLSGAISQMIKAITQEVRSQIDRELGTLIQAEVDAALADVHNRIRSRLALGQTEPAPVVAPLEPRIISSAPGKKPVVNTTSQPVEFTAPVGDPVIHNVTSKRTTPRSKPEADVTAEVEPPKEVRRPKVLIVGIHTNKQAMIAKEFRDCLEVKMLNPDQHSRITASISDGVHVVLWADFVGHKHQEAVQAMTSDMTIVRGGMTSLRDALTEIYVKGQE